ncbi:PHB depolymerase family esterase [Cupriavidus taiwanensis]|uniref:Fibronectin I domain-containing protein n=1 Tax=Cupriavidus taiwanensis TaxID=164546 RepID=A0A375IEG4_9BURK
MDLRHKSVTKCMICACSLILGTLALAAPVQLPPEHVQPDQITTSGISSGGYMAVQMHVAHSALIKGAGVIAGGPYACAQTGKGEHANLQRALGPCMAGSYSIWQRAWCFLGLAICAGTDAPDVALSVEATRTRASAGEIDPVTNLRTQRVLLVSGMRDHTVKPAVMNALEAYYRSFVRAENLRYETVPDADHTFPTDSYRDGNRCSTSAAPYISDCGFDAAGRILKHLYGNLQLRNDGLPRGHLIEFDQTEFLHAPESQGMARTGWLYVPESCASKRCRLHVVFHGCSQSFSDVQRRFIEHAGYNPWADTNSIVVLYPQTMASGGTPYNPKGCWDWWGYTGSDKWDTKEGVQLKAVKGMIDRLSSIR